MSQTLVTDFFGGVAQAEVLPPLIDDGNATSSARLEAEQPTARDDALYSGPEKMPPARDSYNAKLLALSSGQMSPGAQDGGLARTARAWGSMALVGMLVGWVGVRTRARP